MDQNKIHELMIKINCKSPYNYCETNVTFLRFRY